MSTVQVTIPKHLQSQVEQLVSNFNSCTVSNEEDKKMELEQTEVTKVLNHTVNMRGQWSFQLRFRDSTVCWVPDNDCNCEELIRAYLKKLQIKVIYLFCRVSSKKQSRFMTVSLEVQSKLLYSVACNAYNTAQVRIKEYQIAQSAYKQIPTILQHIADLCEPEDVIMTYRVDRLSRNIFLSLNFLEQLYNRNVKVYSATDDKSGLWYHENRLRFLELLLESHKEAEKIGKRVRESNRLRFERGDEAFGQLPYGFRYERELSGQFRQVDEEKIPITRCLRVIVDESEGAIIDRILKQSDIEKILVLFDRQGLRKRGRRWNRQMIVRIRETYDSNWRQTRRPRCEEPSRKRQRTK